MEIEFVKVCGKELSNLTFKIPKGEITGITGHGKTTVLEMLDLLIPTKGTIYFDGKKMLPYQQHRFRQEVVLVSEFFVNQFHLDHIYSYFKYYMMYYHLPIDNFEDKIKGAFKVVGLSSSLLDKSFSDLCSSDIKLVQLALAFLSNPKVILLDEPFMDFDQKQERKIIRILEKLKDKYQKTIVIASNDSDRLYEYTSYLIVLDDNRVLTEGSVEDVYFSDKKIVQHQIDRPSIVEFIDLVEKKKHIKLAHRKDVRDVIKDIYRNV